MDEDDSMDEDDPELSCSCMVSSGDFHVHVLMQRVQLFIEASAGMPSRLAMIFLVRTGLHFGIIIWISS